jgi:hypothetical protein
MDGARSAFLPLAAHFRLRGIEIRWDAVSCHGEMSERTSRRSDGGSLWQEKICLNCLRIKNRPKGG